MKVQLDRTARERARDPGGSDRLTAYLGDLQDLNGELALGIALAFPGSDLSDAMIVLPLVRDDGVGGEGRQRLASGNWWATLHLTT